MLDTGLDPRWSTTVVVFNATGAEAVERLPDMPALHLHPELVSSADPLLRTARAQAGTLIVPARSVAVFVSDAA